MLRVGVVVPDFTVSQDITCESVIGVPDYRESKGRVDVDEQRSNLVPVVEYKTIPPGDDRASQGAQGETVASDEQSWTVGHCPDEDQVEDVDIVAEVEEEIVPGALLVHVHSHW